ncbi:sphingomyelin phosphodiesterase 5-like isoform X2 [Strix uralensis]|uniref:sphingomyelin phosphodiesterase 5-like isoform X2 n=1 Tax=Strix uralensis TaxID=36305 RepID=UPI003DA587BA
MAPGGRAGGTGASGQERGDVTVPLSPLPAPPAPTMLLRESPFPNRALVALDYLARGLLAPSFWATNRLLDLRPTTAERRSRCCGCAGRALAALVYAATLLVSLPLTLLGLLLWLPVQAARRPFAYQYTAGTAPAEPWDLRQRRAFTFLSANVCLLPSGLAKFSNLGQTPQRATYIARQLAPAPPSPAGALVEPRHGHADTYGGTLHTPPGPPASTGPGPGPGPVPVALAEHFPADADFVCLQEVFDAGAAACLRRRLGGTFPHVLSEVGDRGLRCGQLKLLDSGLLLASRYPLLAVQFHGFPNGTREDAMAAKGLLVVQVLLGSARGQRVVGYLGCTHLQAPAGDAAVRDAQLTLALHWLQLFQEAQEQRGDVVAFDVLCGDLNFDNCSRGDELNQRHRLFELYRDPCRRAPGQDEPWAIGTLLNYLKIYEEPVSTPEKLRRTLSEPAGRQRYLAGPILASGQPDPAAPSPWQGRRVDYLLFRPPRGAWPLWTEVAGVTFVTQLATRSDHLPVALRLDVVPATP